MITDKEVCDLYVSGLTIREIADKINFNYERVRKILKNNNIKWSRNYISDLSENQVQDIITRFINNQSIKEIAKWYEISPPAISKLLKYKNIQVSSNRKYDILREVPFTKKHKEIIVGMILGDGCLYKDGSKSNFKLSFGHCEAQSEYFHWKVAMMDPFINNFRKNIDKRKNSIMLQTTTITHQSFNEFGKMFYDSNRIKHVPKGLDMYLSPLALAIWIQDDGNLNAGVNMRIASMSFTEAENYMLRDYLFSCFGLRSKVMAFKQRNKIYNQITLNKENTQKLSNIIRPYVVDSMKYKIMKPL